MVLYRLTLFRPVNYSGELAQRKNIVTRDESYAVVNHRLTIVNGSYFAHLVSTILRTFLDVLYTAKNNQKQSDNGVFYRL